MNLYSCAPTTTIQLCYFCHPNIFLHAWELLIFILNPFILKLQGKKLYLQYDVYLHTSINVFLH